MLYNITSVTFDEYGEILSRLGDTAGTAVTLQSVGSICKKIWVKEESFPWHGEEEKKRRI